MKRTTDQQRQPAPGDTLAPSPAVAHDEGRRRARPRLWHHDYLHLRPLAADLRHVLGHARGESRDAAEPWRILDLGCGASPYREFFPAALAAYVRVDLDSTASPEVIARGESLPFAEATFDGILATQVLQFTDEPQAVVAEIRRLTRPGGRVWLTCHGAWPREGTTPENRYGEPDLERLFSAFERVTVTAEGGYLGLPFALFNLAMREGVRAAERRFGRAALLLRLVAVPCFLAANLMGRLLERLAHGGPLRPFLAHLDSSLPMNYLVVAERGA
ncbi:MAG: class I SAM-dependent methyltransferase [Acidobacteria bacterium]|nr:class I SAM-dependent methyltransferase [Acidobacteriota bacterium]